MKMLMRCIALLVPVTLTVFLARYLRSSTEGVLNPQGAIALAEKHLMMTAFSLMLLVVVPVFVMLFGFAWHFRASNKRAVYAPNWHENTALEMLWWFVPGVVVLFLALITWKSTHDLDPYKPIDISVRPLAVQVVALNWKWLFIYPEQGIASVNLLEFPKGRPLSLSVTSDAPMNGFWIPQLGGQVYAMAGMRARLHLMGDVAGDYAGVSSNFSGDGFSEMKFTARVVEEKEFDEWARSVKENGRVLDVGAYEALAKPSVKNGVALYGTVDKGLYDTILMKYMKSVKGGEIEKNEMGAMKM